MLLSKEKTIYQKASSGEEVPIATPRNFQASTGLLHLKITLVFKK
jgi:hypothetical protein